MQKCSTQLLPFQCLWELQHVLRSNSLRQHQVMFLLKNEWHITCCFQRLCINMDRNLLKKMRNSQVYGIMRMIWGKFSLYNEISPSIASSSRSVHFYYKSWQCCTGGKSVAGAFQNKYRLQFETMLSELPYNRSQLEWSPVLSVIQTFRRKEV